MLKPIGKSTAIRLGVVQLFIEASTLINFILKRHQVQ
jgi:hypothetical protein